MKSTFFTVFILILFTSNLFSQDIHIKSGFQADNPVWGNDILVSGTEPLGRYSSVSKPNGMVYIAIPDTNITSGFALRVYKSTNFGNTWNLMPNGISPAGVINKVKMVKAGADSVYAVYTLGGTLYVWNPETNNLNQFTNYTNLRDFDAEGTSSGAVFIIVDLSNNRDLRIASTLNGGATWAGAIFLSSTGAHAKVTKSSSGDTLIFNYYGPVNTADTINSVIRAVRYRESAAGTLTLSGSFVDVATELVPKAEFMSVYGSNNTIWFYYTTGVSPGVDVKLRVSTNLTSYSTASDVAASPTVDEYGIYAGYNPTSIKCDLIYYYDSTGTTAASDRIMYTSSLLATPTVFTPALQISQRPVVASASTYLPVLTEFQDVTGDAGAVWVALDGANRRVYWDRLNFVTGITNNNELPADYSLMQNYPNPFNPSTTIQFSIPKDDFVTMKVYNLAGELMSTLISKRLQAGSYDISFDGRGLSSGVYFYTLQSGSFIETKKMLLVK